MSIRDGQPPAKAIVITPDSSKNVAQVLTRQGFSDIRRAAELDPEAHSIIPETLSFAHDAIYRAHDEYCFSGNQCECMAYAEALIELGRHLGMKEED